MCVVANIPIVKEITRTLSKAVEDEPLDFDYFAQIALGRINEVKKGVEAYAEQLKRGECLHQSLSIDADILAPVVIIPQDIFEPSGKYLQLDLGELSVKSHLIEY